MITCKEGQHHLVRMRKGFLWSTEMLKIMTLQRWLPDSWLLRMLPSESTQDSVVTKSETKLGTEHLNIASLPAITFSRNMSTSKCWLVTEKLQKKCKKGFHSIVSRGNAQFYMMYGDAWNCMWEKWGRIRMICTQGARWCSQIHALRVHPVEDADKVRHKAGDGALEDGIIAEYHRLVERVTLVRLLRNWKLKFDQELCSPGE